MFGFLKSMFRPIASIGEKIGELMSIGRKSVRPLVNAGEPFKETINVIPEVVPEKFIGVNQFYKGRLRPFDEMDSLGAFRGFKPSYP
jgi:hypothetical protein